MRLLFTLRAAHPEAGYQCTQMCVCVCVCLGGASATQSPLCSAMLSHVGQSLKVSPINGKERSGPLSGWHAHSDTSAALDVRAQSYQFVGSNDLKKIKNKKKRTTEELKKTDLKKNLLSSSSDAK